MISWKSKLKVLYKVLIVEFFLVVFSRVSFYITITWTPKVYRRKLLCRFVLSNEF